MSYILDALRKADAQRERAPSRGIHAQHLTPSEPVERSRNPALWLGVAGAVVLLGMAAAWNWSASQPGQPPTVSAAVPAATSTVPATLPAASGVIVPLAPAARAVMPPAPAAPSAASVQAAPARIPEVRPVPSKPAVAAAAVAASAITAPAAASTVQTEAPPGTPKLTVTGGVYSEQASQRMLIVNGQVFNEGGEPALGVKLEQIRPNRAVLSYQGQRFTLTY